MLAGDYRRGATGNAGDVAVLPVPPSRLPSTPPPKGPFDILLARASVAALMRHLNWHGHKVSEELKQEVRQWVAKEIGALARPDDVRFTEQLPKTRSGKIMRRLLRELATTGDVKGDTTTLEDFAVIAKLRENDE